MIDKKISTLSITLDAVITPHIYIYIYQFVVYLMALSISPDYIASLVGLMDQDSKGSGRGLLDVLFPYLSGRTEGKHKTSVRIAGTQDALTGTEIQATYHSLGGLSSKDFNGNSII
jgi:hypothetical protein